MLDPIKVTIVAPGINPDGSMAEQGIPAALVSKFLEADGVVPEKTNIYSFLMLFSMGVTKGKSGTLLAALFEFKRCLRRQPAPGAGVPGLTRDYPERYQGMGLKDLADEMHQHYRARDMAKIVKKVYDTLPAPALTPAQAYDAVVRGPGGPAAPGRAKGAGGRGDGGALSSGHPHRHARRAFRRGQQRDHRLPEHDGGVRRSLPRL